MPTIEPGTYECWRVISRTMPDSNGWRVNQSEPILDHDEALERAEKVKASIDSYHGPAFSHPWIWTNRRDEVARALPWQVVQASSL